MSYFELDASQSDVILKTIEEFSDGSEAESIIMNIWEEKGEI